MAKDYAKASFKTTLARKQRSQRIFYLFILGFLLLSISSVSAWYICQNGMFLNKEKINKLLLEMKTVFHHAKLQPAVSDNTKSETTTGESPDIHFDFYTELPQMQVTLPAIQNEINKAVPAVINAVKKPEPPIATATQQNKATSSSPPVAKSVAIEQYIVQLGAYKSDSTASGIRVSLLLAGFDVKVVKTVRNKQTIYKILQGPYQTLAQAKSAQKILQEKGFDGVIQKLN